MQPVQEISELLLPFVIIIVSMVIGAGFMFLQTKVDVTEDIKQFVMTFTMIGLGLAISIPIASFVGLLVQMPE
ncbi:hypothetical protein MUB24_03645 [Lederbergia sp. NSJ-179]|uniref:hypothetical protein n=1 Tax=Lederbergia sp. NSJ-179 TaxID=2931402 RepID=UPI001FD1AFF4|nr:hypothetical protein [Lederbergia sp. NSJ-179]MCJ7840017.1 hypothetical protein [Lederbergia sp. NSJ-179]